MPRIVASPHPSQSRYQWSTACTAGYPATVATSEQILDDFPPYDDLPSYSDMENLGSHAGVQGYASQQNEPVMVQYYPAAWPQHYGHPLSTGISAGPVGYSPGYSAVHGARNEQHCILTPSGNPFRVPANTEDIIMMAMAGRIKGMDRIIYSNGAPAVFFSADFVYKGDYSLIQELNRWNGYEQCVISELGLTPSEISALCRIIAGNCHELGPLLEKLLHAGQRLSIEDCSYFDFLYIIYGRGLWELDFRDLNTRLTPQFLIGLTEQQFMYLFRILVGMLHLQPREAEATYHLALLINSLDLDTGFVLSSSNALEIVRTLLSYPERLIYRLISHSIRLRRSLTVQDASLLAESMSKMVATLRKDKIFFLKTYFFLTARFTISNTEVPALSDLHAKFVSAYIDIYGPFKHAHNPGVHPYEITFESLEDALVRLVGQSPLWGEYAVVLPRMFSMAGTDTFRKILEPRYRLCQELRWFQHYVVSVGYPVTTDILRFYFQLEASTPAYHSNIFYRQLFKINNVILHPHYDVGAFKFLLKTAIKKLNFTNQVYLLQRTDPAMIAHLTEEDWDTICRCSRQPGFSYLPHIGAQLGQRIALPDAWSMKQVLDYIDKSFSSDPEEAQTLNSFYAKYLLTCSSEMFREKYPEYLAELVRLPREPGHDWREVFRYLLTCGFYGPTLRTNVRQIMAVLSAHDEAESAKLRGMFLSVLDEQAEGKGEYTRLCSMVGPLTTTVCAACY